MKKYRYSLTSIDESSQKYGNCDICGEYVSDVFYQKEERHYKFKQYEGWTKNKCHNYFGHKDCLISKQNNELVEA